MHEVAHVYSVCSELVVTRDAYLPNSKHESGADWHSLPIYLLLQNPCYLEQCSNFLLGKAW